MQGLFQTLFKARAQIWEGDIPGSDIFITDIGVAPERATSKPTPTAAASASPSPRGCSPSKKSLEVPPAMIAERVEVFRGLLEAVEAHLGGVAGTEGRHCGLAAGLATTYEWTIA